MIRFLNLFRLILVGCIGLLLSCEIGSSVANSPCGDSKSEKLIAKSGDLITKATYVTMIGDARTYYYEVEAINVCTKEHPSYTVKATAQAGAKPGDFAVVGGANWYILFGESFNLSYTGGSWSKTNKVGLKQNYGDGPGKYWPYIQISFTSLGTQEADDLFLVTWIKQVEVTANYSEYKN
jgi:hypothetical protein